MLVNENIIEQVGLERRLKVNEEESPATLIGKSGAGRGI